MRQFDGNKKENKRIVEVALKVTKERKKMEDKKQRMLQLVEILNQARRAYEQEDREIMSNYEYDKLYDELLGLEQELGMTLASSPTIHVGYEVLSELPKERHEKPMLSHWIRRKKFHA